MVALILSPKRSERRRRKRRWTVVQMSQVMKKRL